MSGATSELFLDRPHRFKIGDRIRHIDSPDAIFVARLTLRVRDGVAYPTYTLKDPRTGELVPDVLCTYDLVPASARPAAREVPSVAGLFAEDAAFAEANALWAERNPEEVTS
jgi:hypothetical protein